MPKSRKPKGPKTTVRAGHTEWAIINKETGIVIGLFNPHGKPTALRRVAITAARDAGLSFTKVSMIPAGLLSAEAQERGRIHEAPILLDSKTDVTATEDEMNEARDNQ